MKLKDRFNKQYVSIMLYVIATVVIIYALARIVDHLPVIWAAVTTNLRSFASLLSPLLWGFIIAYLLYPVVGFFQRHLENRSYYKKRKKSARGAAVAVTALLTVLFFVLLLSLIISTLTSSLQMVSMTGIENLLGSIVDTLKGFYKALEKWLAQLNIASDSLNNYLQSAGDAIGNILDQIGNRLLLTLNNVKSFFTNLLFAVIFSVYFLTDGDRLMKYWKRVVTALTGRRLKKHLKVIVGDLDMVFSGYIRGQLIDATFMAVVVSVGLTLVGVQYSIIIGVLTGIGNLIPYVGPFVAYASTIIVCVINGDIKKLIIAVIVLFIIQTVDGNVINPRLLSQSVDVHPVLVILALIIGGAAGGVLGMLVAVPIAAFMKIQFERIINLLMKTRGLE